MARQEFRLKSQLCGNLATFAIGKAALKSVVSAKSRLKDGEVIVDGWLLPIRELLCDSDLWLRGVMSS